MSVFRRLFQVFPLALVALLALDDNARTMTGGFFQDSYAFVTGAEPTPLPLERPPFLALADLDDCLRGTARVAGEDAYAAFCTDLASFTDGQDEMPVAGNSPPAPPPLRQEAHAADDCFVDARGIPARKIDGIWVRPSPPERDGGPQGREPSRLVAVPPHCPVQSPAKAQVLYAGFFKGYLGVVILETEKKDRITVAGLGRVEVDRGDRIQRGSRIGETSAVLAPALQGAAAGKGHAALLYVADGGPAKPSS